MVIRKRLFKVSPHHHSRNVSAETAQAPSKIAPQEQRRGSDVQQAAQSIAESVPIKDLQQNVDALVSTFDKHAFIEKAIAAIASALRELVKE